MNHNFGLHLGITTHLEKIYGVPSFESWCDIKTKVKRGKLLGINYDPQALKDNAMQQVEMLESFGMDQWLSLVLKQIDPSESDL